MVQRIDTNSRQLLSGLRDIMAEEAEGQTRLDKITALIATTMRCEVCSIYMFRDAETLELCATIGLNAEAVHMTRMRVGEGLVGRVARTSRVINTANAPAEAGFRYMPETGEEVYSSFIGVPLQRLGETLGVLVVQSKEARQFSPDSIYALEVVAMVLSEMTELGVFVSDNDAMAARHQQAAIFQGVSGQEGAAQGHVWLHEPRVVVTNPVADDPHFEFERLEKAIDQLREGVDELLADAREDHKEGEHIDVLKAYRMFAHSKSWVRRLEEDISRGLSAEAAVEKEQSAARARLSKVPDPYMRERLHDLDDLSNRLLRILTGQTGHGDMQMPTDAILVARNIGPAELLEYGRGLRGIVLEQGSVGSHAGVVARALAIPLIVQAEGITTEALNGDHILVDGDEATVHLRPDEAVTKSFRDKMAMHAAAQSRYAAIRDTQARTKCGKRIHLMMNAGLMADLPSLENSGAEGVGLFRTELQFLTSSRMPTRDELRAQYARVLDAAGDKRVIFRTLDIGSDKVTGYMKREDEPNPALGWRAIRVALDRPSVMRMQLQALLRAANGRPLNIMFPFIAQLSEFRDARAELDRAVARETKFGTPIHDANQVGAMLETPSLAYAHDALFQEADFLSIGGNDLKQFFFAADRENERVRRRYDTLSLSFLNFLQHIVTRANTWNTRLSFCGEDAGRTLEAIAFAAIGIDTLSMRPASVGPVKHALLQTDLREVRDAIERAAQTGQHSARAEILKVIKG
ncbi:MAG: phosphoenolpyruvate--protein phosphotransferase [Paracoccaceae bacterium]